ncbi:ImuA family protein [Rhizobium setariae]|uniref:ImuA family protein n=1 Tax=Rhizobium setariae TaxID=2801340 RepID=UPI001FED8D39|nr:hypothetical protein [Rhizobium setariae]
MAQAALAHEALSALRTEIDRLESGNPSPLAIAGRQDGWQSAGANPGDGVIASGAAGFDLALGGGVARAALNEIRSAATADNGAASGFALALCGLALGQVGGDGSQPRLLWIADPMGTSESGRLYGPGLARHGVPPSSMLHARPRHLKDALMIAEAALAVNSFAAVILEIYGNPPKFGLTESRRLNLRAKAHRRPLFLLRERGEEEASNAAARFVVGPAPAAPERLPGGRFYPEGMGNPVFHVTIEKSRNPSPPDFYLEWNADDRLFHEIDRDRIVVPAGHHTEGSVALLSLPRHRPDRAQALGSVLAFPRAS